jgi:hypothetical protein
MVMRASYAEVCAGSTRNAGEMYVRYAAQPFHTGEEVK